MKNVTIALDDETHRAARIRAAELGTSLSALVKDYLQGLVGSSPQAGVREMPMNYTAANSTALLPPKGPDGQPYCVDGKWVWTKDGKPRQPGSKRGMWIADDFDEWPDGFIDALYGDDTEAANNWWKPFAKPPTKPAK
jgi:plasmid stability protein